ncbi:hypothetical protein ABZS88_24305 [Streptomyces sp. NPDC005480]|uniref:hypothetical protein n=1 Tax=Streptomyces sp. NPDC005480 TaxID=3154880 RepID=UPI0033A092BD
MEHDGEVGVAAPVQTEEELGWAARLKAVEHGAVRAFAFDSPVRRDISALHSSEGVLDASSNALMGAALSCFSRQETPRYGEPWDGLLPWVRVCGGRTGRGRLVPGCAGVHGVHGI